MRRRQRFWTLACAALLGFGCITPVTEEAVEAQLERAAQPFDGLGRRRVIPIYAETNLIASALLTEAKANPESPPAVRLAHSLAAAAKRNIHVVVGGPYPELSDRIVRNALLLNREQGLRGLTLVYVSEQRPSAELADAARSVRARLYHRHLP